MESSNAIEEKRAELQRSLDAAKTPAARNKLGQFSTPAALATDILTLAKSLMEPGTPVRFLDPAFGTGSFYSALLNSFPEERIAYATGYEVDPHYGDKAIELWGGTPLKLETEDFTDLEPPGSDDAKANLLICNPPYVRHHHLSAEDKERLREKVEALTGIVLSGLSGLYPYFLCLSHAWMSEGGIAGWLIPSEFMDVNYGRQVKEYLLSQVTLLRIHRYDPADMQFDDALVSSAVVWFKKAMAPDGHAVEFTYGGSLLKPRVLKLIPLSGLRAEDKWTPLPLESERRIDAAGLKLSDLFEIKRGLATGANDFFILNEDQIAAHDLPSKFLIPILPSSRHLDTDEVNADKGGKPILSQKLFLLSCDWPEAQIREQYPSLWAYLEKGIGQGIHERYLCKHRTPWYSQEERPAAPFLCTYMGRSRMNGRGPFRFILNHSDATAANVYLMLYPKGRLRRALEDRPQLKWSVWEALKAITTQTLINGGRVYGGGLHKVEPRELAGMPADKILNTIAMHSSTHP